MSKSYESVNYALRPAKNIERKMFCEAFRKLSEFGSLDTYRYIGFGSTFFSDFSLFHKSLKITNNLSIEREKEDEERFRFNLPYKCIDLIFGESNEILRTLPWDVRTIIWLDYDSKLNRSMLSDVNTVCSHAIPGSLFIMTVDARPDEYDERVESLKNRIGELNVPEGLTEPRLGDWGTANAYRQIITDEILSTLNSRNGGRRKGTKYLYKQFFNFHYADTAKMLTVGGLIFDEGQKNLVSKCGFENLDYIKTGTDAYEIKVPNLTFKEIRYLDKQLPCEDLSTIETHSIPINDIKLYADLYRYFPTFVDAEIG